MAGSFDKNLEKIVVNAGIGRFSSQPDFPNKILPSVMAEMGMITGQKPMICAAKKSIAGFKLREGTVIGLKTTLRKKRMAEFLRKLINAALPRVRDFRGINTKSVDANGNLTIGLKEHWIFPEVNLETSKVNYGLEITLVPKIRDRIKALELYKELGIPFKKN